MFIFNALSWEPDTYSFEAVTCSKLCHSQSDITSIIMETVLLKYICEAIFFAKFSTEVFKRYNGVVIWNFRTCSLQFIIENIRWMFLRSPNRWLKWQWRKNLWDSSATLFIEPGRSIARTFQVPNRKYILVSLFHCLGRFREDCPVTSIELFATVIFLQGRIVGPASNPQPGGPSTLILVCSSPRHGCFHYSLSLIHI